MPPVEIAAPPPTPAKEIAQLSRAPLCLPPTSCPGWIAPCLHSLTVAEALRLERTSRRWRAWLQGADHIWQQLAASSGVSLRCEGPLARFFRVTSWRRVCVELIGALSRDLRGDDVFAEEAAPGALLEVFETVAPEMEFAAPLVAEVFEPSQSFRPSDRGVPVRLSDQRHAWATRYRVLKPGTPQWWRAASAVDVDDAAARDFCAGLAGRHWVAEAGGVFTFCASRTATPTHYRFANGEWRWSPDRLNWTCVTEFLSGGVRWRARTLSDGDRQICRFLSRRAPQPEAWRLAPTCASLAYAAPQQRRRDDMNAARSAHRSVRPDAHGGVLALADTRVQVIHASFAPPRRILHAEPHVVQGHPGGWLAADDHAGASWSLGLGSAEDVVGRGFDDDD